MSRNAEWEYKGFKCRIEEDRQEDKIDYYATVIDPHGREYHPHICNYDTTQKTVELWIDAGCPDRHPTHGNWDRKDLQIVVAQKDAEYWKNMAMRAHCGCIAKDCALHGSYVAEYVDRFFKERREVIAAENKRLESIHHPTRWHVNQWEQLTRTN